MEEVEVSLDELVARAAQGDRSAWEAVESACHSIVANYVRYKIPSAQLAGAVTAETFQRAWRMVGSYDPKAFAGFPDKKTLHPVRTWLLRIARDEVLRHRGRPDEPA